MDGEVAENKTPYYITAGVDFSFCMRTKVSKIHYEQVEARVSLTIPNWMLR
jgi:hypothetical protein